MVGDQINRIKDWLHSGDVAHLDRTNRDGSGIRGGMSTATHSMILRVSEE